VSLFRRGRYLVVPLLCWREAVPLFNETINRKQGPAIRIYVHGQYRRARLVCRTCESSDTCASLVRDSSSGWTTPIDQNPTPVGTTAAVGTAEKHTAGWNALGCYNYGFGEHNPISRVLRVSSDRREQELGFPSRLFCTMLDMRLARTRWQRQRIQRSFATLWVTLICAPR
jgi:hypothetical protein